MAVTPKFQKIIQDTPSLVVEELRLQFNALLAAVAALTGAGTDLTTNLQNAINSVYQIKFKHELPAPPLVAPNT